MKMSGSLLIMEYILDWIKNNHYWIFSGIGVFLLGLTITLLKKRKKHPKKNMNQISGNHSVNIQIGGDINHGK